MSVLELGEKPRLITRRRLLVGGAAAAGLVVAWGVWPRDYRPGVPLAEGEHGLGGWVKIGVDGHITILCPHIEQGQGIFTVMAQTIADELGADWRTIAIEPAPVSPYYANRLFLKESGYGPMTDGVIKAGLAQVTGGSTSLRGYGLDWRRAGAAARAMLCMAAADRWDADWQACETADGFVTRGQDKLAFAVLASEAAAKTPPDHVPFKSGGETRLIGQSLPRLDTPAKLDGSVNYAADVRLPGMLFAAIRQGPIGATALAGLDRKAALAVPGVIRLVEQPAWVAALANSWWAANRALDAARPRFRMDNRRVADRTITAALDAALKAKGYPVVNVGDAAASFRGQRAYRADYSVGLAAHAAIEPMAATARVADGGAEVWIGTQAPGAARRAVAKALVIDEARVIIHAMQIGGSFGRKYEAEAAAQAALLAQAAARPVQLLWSRPDDMMQDRFRPAARAQMAARLLPAGIDTWSARIAIPAANLEANARLFDGMPAMEAMSAAVGQRDGLALGSAAPPYAIANLRLDHCPADLGVPVGRMRGGFDAISAFFTECFIDELSAASGIEPFSFRMGMLGGNPRLGHCLSQAATLGGWEGGAQGTGQGLACHAMLGSHAAVLAEAHLGEDQRVRVTRLVAVVDVGRMAHPDIVRQQIEGGLMFGLSLATGEAVTLENGVARPMRLGRLGLPTLADCPDIQVELVRSTASAGGVSDIVVPAVAPAIANALHAGSGRRFRSLPLSAGTR